MYRVNWAATSVPEKIQCLDDRNARKRCKKAYNFLINCSESSYNSFTEKHLEHLGNEQINLYNHVAVEGIECALWPNIYPYTRWCETVLKVD